ncbi:MAG: hypothetical protein ACRD3S_16605, partial [Terracidiphilus sp.]
MGGKPIQASTDDVYSLITHIHYDMAFDEKYRSDMEGVAKFYHRRGPDWSKVFNTSALKIVSPEAVK